MKPLKTIILLGLVFIVFACKKEDENHLPTQPKLLEPLKGAVVAPEQINFKWKASTDVDKDDVLYHNLFISSDSSSWKSFDDYNDDAEFALTNDPSNEYNYYPFEYGKKYFWKVIATTIDDYDGKLTGTTESDILSFYTIPNGVSNLSKTSGNGFVNLAWTDPAGLSRVEVTFSPSVISITQPIVINPGVGKVELQGMQNETIYNFYVKAFNSLEHGSKVDTIKAMPLSPTLVHDADFNIYTTVQIGVQTWMRENLKTTRWQDGSLMKYEYGNYYTYGSKSNIYGLYYSRIVAEGGQNKDKNPCPCGYHVPTDDDFKTLERYLGVTEDDINNLDSRYVRGEAVGAGNLLKSTTGWDDYNGVNGNGTDLYAFNLKPAGWLYFYASESNVIEEKTGVMTVLFTSTGQDRSFSSSFKGLMRGTSFGYRGSIRCLKN